MFYARPPSALHFRIFRIAEVEIPTVQRQRPTFPWQQWKSGEVALTGSDFAKGLAVPVGGTLYSYNACMKDFRFKEI